MFASQSLTDDDVERFAGAHIDDCQCSKPCSVHELIGDEIHRPCRVGPFRDVTFATSDGHLPATWPLAAQLRALSGVEPKGLVLTQ